MKHTISTLESYETYLTTGATRVTGEPSTDQYSFDESTGIMKVNLSGNYAFEIRIPITGLTIGDKVKATCDVKHISGGAVQLSNDFEKEVTGDVEGKYRLLTVPDKTIDDFQTLELEFIYEGYNSNLLVTNDNSKQFFIRIYFPDGYGGSKFQIKNLSVESNKINEGVTLGTRTYYGIIEYDPADGFSVVSGRGSHNYNDFTITIQGRYLVMNFKNKFYTRPFIFLEMSNQTKGNNGVYDVRLSTSESGRVLLYIYDVINNVILDNPVSVDVSMYFNFFIIGE